MQGESRTESVKVFLSHREKLEIEFAAEENGDKLSQYMRRAALAAARKEG